MRLYHFPLSSNARRARMTAIQLGVPVEEVLVDLAKGQQKTPEYLALNPSGRVPVLVDGDFVLTESHAIMAYLADVSGPTPLYPAELQPRASVNRWLFWSAHHFAPSVAVLNWERLVRGLIGGGPADPREEERGERLVTECARLLDDHLAKNEWLAEGRLTLADIAVATPLMSTVPARLPIDDRRHLRAWFGRIQELDSWKKTNPAR